jgi:aminoglycoside N3'-acetyltransferase
VNASSPGRGLADVLEELNVPRQRLLYVQASADWIQRAGLDVSDVLPTLIAWSGSGGTLVMPSYPFHTTHQEYLESRPVFDVLRTPSMIGLLPEIFRRSKGAVRSLDPDFCVSALGLEAEDIVGTAPAAPDPFGPDSSYQRMLGRGATLVGLGVSLNTSSFIHLIDSRAEAGYPSPAYGDQLFSTTVIDASGCSHDVRRKLLRPRFQQLTCPSAIVAEMRPADPVFLSTEINGARFFKWDLDQWSSWCLDHAREQAAVGAWPCWLGRLSGREE